MNSAARAMIRRMSLPLMGDGIICGITGIDADGNAITPFINYLDSRTKEDVDAINSTPREIWGRETGNPEASCMFPAMFARWFRRIPTRSKSAA